jgi:hypothetical protein
MGWRDASDEAPPGAGQHVPVGILLTMSAPRDGSQAAWKIK